MGRRRALVSGWWRGARFMFGGWQIGRGAPVCERPLLSARFRAARSEAWGEPLCSPSGRMAARPGRAHTTARPTFGGWQNGRDAGGSGETQRGHPGGGCGRGPAQSAFSATPAIRPRAVERARRPRFQAARSETWSEPLCSPSGRMAARPGRAHKTVRPTFGGWQNGRDAGGPGETQRGHPGDGCGRGPAQSAFSATSAIRPRAAERARRPRFRAPASERHGPRRGAHMQIGGGCHGGL